MSKNKYGRPLSENEKVLLSRISRLRKDLTKSRKMTTRTKQRLMRKQINIFKDVNETTIQLFLSQVRNQKLHPKGRRFTLDDKIFALSLFKQSGKSYRFISKILALPSRKTLFAT